MEPADGDGLAEQKTLVAVEAVVHSYHLLAYRYHRQGFEGARGYIQGGRLERLPQAAHFIAWFRLKRPRDVGVQLTIDPHDHHILTTAAYGAVERHS